MSRCLTWACSCSAMRWCWRGGMCVTHLSRRLTGAHTRSWPLWLWPAWLSERSHTHAVSFYLLKKYNKYWIWTVFSVWWLKVTGSSFSVDVSHAFVLEGPRRSWVCATERGEERDHFLSVLRSAITSALTGDQWRHRGDASARQEEVWTPLLLCVIIKGNFRFLTNQQDAILFPVSKRTNQNWTPSTSQYVTHRHRRSVYWRSAFRLSWRFFWSTNFINLSTAQTSAWQDHLSSSKIDHSHNTLMINIRENLLSAIFGRWTRWQYSIDDLTQS